MSFVNASQPRQAWFGLMGNTARSYDTVRAILDASRRNNLINIEVMDGKKRDLKVSYYPLNCDPVGDCNTTICDSGVVAEPIQQYFSPQRCLASKPQQLNVSDLRMVDDGGLEFSDHARMQIMATLPKMREQLALQINALLIAHSGLLPNGTATMRLPFANSNNGQANPTGKWTIERLFADGGYQQPYILGGSQELYTWQRSLAATAPGGQNGFTAAGMGMDNVYYDATVNAAYGDGGQHIIAFDPNVLKFVTWSKNRGIFATDLTGIQNIDNLFRESKTGSIHGAFVDPVYGLTWDFDAKYFDCVGPNKEGYFRWQISLQWDILFMPDANCNLQGVNGIFHFTTCAPVLAPCPTGDALPTPIAPGVFEWTPGDGAVPRFIHALQLAGVATEPNTNAATLADLAAIMSANTGMAFTVSGSKIQYTGVSAVSGTINGGTANGGLAITFTPAA